MRTLRLSIYAAVFLWVSCKAPEPYSNYTYRQYDVRSAATDSGMYHEILPYRRQLETEMNRVIGYADMEMPKQKGKTETLLGNFVADLVLKSSATRSGAPVNFCLLNNGGLRNSLPQGNITVGNIYELMPFDNELVVLTLRGSTVQKLADYVAAAGGHPVSGLRMEISEQNKAYPIYIGNTLLAADTQSLYTVVTSDYLANGGDNMSFFSEAVNTRPLGYKLRDCILDYIVSEQQAGRHIVSALDGRITRTAHP